MNFNGRRWGDCPGCIWNWLTSVVIAYSVFGDRVLPPFQRLRSSATVRRFTLAFVVRRPIWDRRLGSPCPCFSVGMVLGAWCTTTPGIRMTSGLHVVVKSCRTLPGARLLAINCLRLPLGFRARYPSTGPHLRLFCGRLGTWRPEARLWPDQGMLNIVEDRNSRFAPLKVRRAKMPHQRLSLEVESCMLGYEDAPDANTG